MRQMADCSIESEIDLGSMVKSWYVGERGNLMTHQPVVVGLHSLATGVQGLPTILVVGHERRTRADQYAFDCRTRTDPHLLLQYTVSGEGEIELDNQWHRLPAGRAFLIEVPGPFHYRLPVDSAVWELRYISLSRDCLPWWNPVVAGLGRMVTVPLEHSVVHLLSVICTQAAAGEIRDTFHNSLLAYEFLMELYRLMVAMPGDADLPFSVRRALQFMQQELFRPIGLQDVSAAAGISRFHLIRLFQEHVGESPTQHLIKLRIAKAAKLLVETTLSIESIALQTGFANGNYFAKSFRKWMRMPPSRFRADAQMRGLERIYFT